MNYRSVLAGGEHSPADVAATGYATAMERFPVKFYFFLKHGYTPHPMQGVMHGGVNPETGRIARFRHLVAGRRGGKTLSAAWEVLFYAMHPAEFHRDVHGREYDRQLWIWLLTKDYPTGYPALTTLLDVMHQAGLVKGKDYDYNKTERRIEFRESGTVIQVKTAEDPQSLRGAGLDILWIDEAAFLDNADAWRVVRPALSDKMGLVITTTTPNGKNWLWTEFFDGPAMDDTNQFRVEYTSIDNPFFPREEWEYAREHYHPIFFRQEYLASFDAFAGVALHADWLKYWVTGIAEPKSGDLSMKSLIRPDGTYALRIFIGIDPAISLADDADHFAVAVIGITDDNAQAFLLDTYLGRLDFPDQIDMIRELQLKWRPELIGIESNAFQKAIVQQAARLEGFPGIVPVFSKGQKNDRILSMSPLFKIGKVRIHRRHADFLDQWVSFNPEKKNQSDDLLDAVEIALGVAGVLLPTAPMEVTVSRNYEPTMEELAREQLRARRSGANRPYDPEMGSEW